jgi:single-stranded-DNA-specific exonuclease
VKGREFGSSAALVAARRRWELRDIDDAAARSLGKALGLQLTTARVLVARGHATAAAAEAFLDPGLDQLHSPFAFAQMEKAVERIRAAIGAGEKIAVHGDYDVDGISGSVLLAKVLGHLGAAVDLILPHRVADGYGLNPGGVERAHAGGARLLVAVDCGITGWAACERAAELGIDVIIVDHHLPQGELPRAQAILNPRLPDSGYPEADLAAVGVAFKLARALLEKSGSSSKGLALLKLVALGTVADLVPLRGENRVLARHGLAGLGDAVNPGMRALMEVSGVDPRRVTAGDIGFRLAPRINAAGRVGHPEDAAQMFMTEDPAEARRLAGRLQQLNTERQELERAVFAEAAAADDLTAGPIVVAAGEGWHRGVVGIVASRLVEMTARPALAISISEGVAHGSARSVPGFDITAALESAAALLDSYGGHHQAAGFSLPAARLDELRAALWRHAEAFDPEELRASLLCDDVLRPDDVTMSLALELERLAPFGIGNPRPKFLCEGLRLAGPPQLLKEQHLKLRCRAGDETLDVLGWNRADAYQALLGAESVDLVATVRLNRFGGRVRPQLEIADLQA